MYMDTRVRYIILIEPFCTYTGMNVCWLLVKDGVCVDVDNLSYESSTVMEVVLI